jgi:hypothetical protein
MAIINKTGITNGGTVQAEHITRTIDALSGVSTDSIVATGSLLGTASYAITAVTASAIQVTNDTLAAGPRPILLANSTGTTSQLVRMDQSDFSFNPISNLLTVANISSTTGSIAPVTMTASLASTASSMVSNASVRVPSGSMQIPSGSISTLTSQGQIIWGNFENISGYTAPDTAVLTIHLNGQNFLIFGTQI